MRPITVTVGPLAAASADAICLSQTPVAGPFTLNGALVSGGVAYLDVPRRVLFTCAADESANSFTVTGTDWSGNPISEVVPGPAVSASTVLDYSTVTSITISGNAAGAIEAGTSSVAASRWVRLDEWALPQTAIQCVASGTVNFTVQQTLDDPNDPVSPVPRTSVTWVNHPDTALVGATGTVQGNYGYAPLYARVLLNSGTGSVRATFNQSGVVSR
jgi:hypothetical protein